jgi:hypothetical protein
VSDELKNECSFNSYCLVIIKIIVLSESSANECLQALFGYNIFDTLIDLSSKYVLTIYTIEFCDIHTMKWTGSYDMSQVY